MKKTPVWQIVLLVALLGVLGFAMVRAFSGAVAPKKSAPAAATPTAGAGAPASDSGGGGSATDMPSVVPTTSRGRLGEGVDAGAKAAAVNPNLFKVYQVQPPRNPFVQKEEWYAANIAQVPGYPELTESDYFDSMEAYLPDIGFIYDNPEDWRAVSVSRDQDNKFTLSGTSEDGMIQTNISLEKDIPTESAYSWEKGSDVPLTALKNPDWVMEQIRKGQNQARAPEEVQTQYDENGLPIPEAGSATSSAAGDTFSVYGVSLKGGRSSALILYNGSPRIVAKGAVLPTHYEVIEINADGVVLVDLKTGFSIPVPLGGEAVPAE